MCYPVIFSVATADLGTYAKIGSGVVALGVSGGAAYPSIQGAVADHVSTWRSFFIPLTGFVPLMVYGFTMWIINSRKYSGKLTIWNKKVSVKRLLLSKYKPLLMACDRLLPMLKLSMKLKPKLQLRSRRQLLLTATGKPLKISRNMPKPGVFSLYTDSERIGLRGSITSLSCFCINMTQR